MITLVSQSAAPTLPTAAAAASADCSDLDVAKLVKPRRVTIRRACQHCRKSRTKCDGLPTCTRCSQRGKTCSYERPLSQTVLRRRAQKLASIEEDSDLLLADPLKLEIPEADPKISRANGTEPTITVTNPTPPAADKAGEAECETSISFQDWMHALREAGGDLGPADRTSGSSPSSPCSPAKSEISDASTESSCLACSPASSSFDDSINSKITSTVDFLGPQYDIWTSSGWVKSYVRYLIASVLSWDGLPLCIVDKERFLEDYNTGLRQYCSSALVNALLAVAIRLEQRRQGNENTPPPPGVETTSDVFLREACEYLRGSGPVFNLPDAQAVGVLAIYHTNFGEDVKAHKLADEYAAAIADLCLSEPAQSLAVDYKNVRANTYRAAISMQRLFQLTGINSLPSEPEGSHEFFCSPKPIDEDMDTVEPDVDASQPCQRACPQHMTAAVFQLTGWLSNLSANTDRKPEATTDFYSKCLGWYADTFPNISFGVDIFGNPQSAVAFGADQLVRTEDLPQATFTHMLYHYAILLALAPFTASNPDHRIGNLLTRNVCQQAAQSIISLAAPGETHVAHNVEPLRGVQGRFSSCFISIAESYLAAGTGM